jgi:Fic family protein
MGDLERFLHDRPVPTSVLIKAALAHVQFETIHPFLDGNGRLGRLLITLILCDRKFLREPLLYLSLYLKKHRSHYYAILNDVRTRGNWELWLEFFLDAVTQTAQQAVGTVQLLQELQAKDVRSIETLGRISPSVKRVHDSLSRRPVATIRLLSQRCKLNVVTVGKCMLRLKELGIVNELTGHRRNRVFIYQKYLEILNQGLE